MKAISLILTIAYLTSICPAFCDDNTNLSAQVEEFRAKIENIDHADFKRWKQLRTEWKDLFKDVKRVPKNLLPETAQVGERIESLLLKNFKAAVENRDTEEAADIFIYFGSVPMKARLAGVLAECPDNEFVARIVHRELDPKAWSREALNNHAMARLNLETFRALDRLYYDKLRAEPRPKGISTLGGFTEENCAPYRRRLEKKYPFLAEAQTNPEPAAQPGSEPPPPVGNPPGRPPNRPPAPETTPPPPSGATSFPWLPPALAAAFLLLAFLSWRVLRNRRSDRA